MRSLLKHILSFILVVIATGACSEKIQLELDDGETQIVIEAAVSNTTSNQIVRISMTSPYYDSLPVRPVRNAKVNIYDDTRSYDLIEVQPGTYITNFSFGGKPGLEYRLKVEFEGEIYEASSTMPRVPAIDSIKFTPDEDDPQLFHIGLFAQENPLPGDFYFWGVFKDLIYQTTNLSLLSYTSDELINGSYINGNSVQSVKAGPGNRITLQMASIPKDYFNYCISVLQETVYNDGLFEAAPANIEGNISNGALGFFFTYSENFRTQVIKIEE